MKMLVVVDVQNDFIDGTLGSNEAIAVMPNIINKIKEYDNPNSIIVFTKDTHYSDYLTTVEGKYLPVPHCIQDTNGWQIPNTVACVKYAKTYFVSKPTFGFTDWNCYIGTDLDSIEIIGFCTDICVVTNALIIQAAARTFYEYNDFHISCDSSCCAGTTPDAHEAALKVMKSCQIEVK